MEKLELLRLGEYVIRRAEEDDIKQVIEINEKTLPEHYSDFFYYEILSEFPEGFLVAEINKKVVGYIMCRIEFGFSNIRRLGLAKKGHIVSIAVLEEHRRKGIGKALISLALEQMAKKSCTESYLEVRVTNKEAISLYEKMNYRIVSTLHGYYRDGESAYLMATQIQDGHRN